MEYNTQKIRLCFFQEIVYQAEGVEKHLMLDGDRKSDGQVEGVCQIRQGADGDLQITVQVKNIGEKLIFLQDVDYIRVKSRDEFIIDGKTMETWQIYRQGRHKNDIPTICCPGDMDGRLLDGIGGMTETGDQTSTADMDHPVLRSDSMTIFHTADQNVLFGYMTGRESLVDCKIVMGSGKDTRDWAIRCGCSPVSVYLEPGKTFDGGVFVIRSGAREQTLIERYAAEKAERYHARRQLKAPSVFCIWYYYGLTVTYEDVKESLEQIQEKKLPFDVFQVDEGWEITLGEWEPNQKFPCSMKQIADQIREAGMRPGIWTSPFIAHETATVWKQHPEWRLNQKDGSPCLFHMNDTVYYVLDITNPQTWSYFTELYRKLTDDWGYTYHKLDFTRAPVIYEDADFFDPTITLTQAYYQAVKAVRAGMGEKSYFLMCGGLYDPVIGLVDGQRMGADVLSMWVSDINRDGKALPFTVKQNLLRYYMNQWWNNDPDALMVRRQKEMVRNLRLTLGLLNEEEVKTAVVNQYIGGGLICSTEPLTRIDEDRLYQIEHILPVLERKVEVKNLFSGKRFPDTVDVFLPEKGWHSLVKINWDDKEEQPASMVLNENLVTDLMPGKCYLVAEFYSGQYQTGLFYGDMVQMGVIKPHGSAIFKIQEYDPEQPYIVGSNAHYSMGGEIETLSMQEEQLVLIMNHRFKTNIWYRVLLPKNYESESGEVIITVQVDGAGRKECVIPLKKRCQNE